MQENQGVSAHERGGATTHERSAVRPLQNAIPVACAEHGAGYVPCQFEQPVIGRCGLQEGHAGDHCIPLGDGLDVLVCDSQGTYRPEVAQ